jgi:hypothetical protein
MEIYPRTAHHFFQPLGEKKKGKRAYTLAVQNIISSSQTVCCLAMKNRYSKNILFLQ